MLATAYRPALDRAEAEKANRAEGDRDSGR